MQRPYRDRERQLKLDDSVLIAHIQKRRRDYIEVCRHRSRKRTLDPAVSVMMAAIAGSTPNGCTINGTSTPVAITGKAANEFPMMMVNSVMPSQFASTSKKRLSCGMTRVMPPAISSPILAAVNIIPIEASNWGKMLNDPMASVILRPSSNNMRTRLLVKRRATPYPQARQNQARQSPLGSCPRHDLECSGKGERDERDYKHRQKDLVA